MSDKIQGHHLQRTAYVYVRQSTVQQVRFHKESQLRQYGLEKRAQDLGFRKTIVIDDDLGRSGSGRVERPGFARLLTAVCEGKAGAVLAMEASRLARNNRDWHHLIDLCALTETLIIDEDGIYDSRTINDRLLLGLKGTMSEFELSLFRQRARQAFEEKIQRGFFMWEVPVGFIRTEEDLIEKIPDLQVQQAIESVFGKFREFGSARQALLWFRDEQIPLPEVKAGTSGKEINWTLPQGNRIRQILKNPCYAGALAYGRTAICFTIQDGRSHQSSNRRRKPIPEWKVLIRNHHEGYISWEEYLQNQKILEANVIMQKGATGGASKNGAALLSGLLRCARCGRQLRVAYSGKSGRIPRYSCDGGRVDRGSSPCLGLGSLRVDQAVVQEVLASLQPAGIQAAFAAIKQEVEHHGDKQRSLELALEKARYEASRAQRQYDAVDPENRLVASELERRWNEALQRVDELQEQLNISQQNRIVLTEQQKQRILHLGRDVSALWEHLAAPVELKKRILRTVLHEIIVDNLDQPPLHLLVLHWQGGVHTRLSVPRNHPGSHRNKVDGDVIELIRELSKVCDDKTIAATLNRLGYRTGVGKTWHRHSVYNARWYHKIRNYRHAGDWLTIQQAADSLKVSTSVMRRLIDKGILPANQVVQSAPWIINGADLELPAVQAQIKAIHNFRKPPKFSPDQIELPRENQDL